jgi:DNA polymerase-3 subunit delta
LLYVLYGEDDFSLNEALEEIRQGIGDQSLIAANTTLLEGRQITLNELATVCGTVPFLADRRLVIVKGLLERFQGKGKSGRRKADKPTISQEGDCQPWASCLASVPETTILVLVDGAVNHRNPLITALTDRAKIRAYPLLSRDNLRRWIEERVDRAGGSISPPAVKLLASVVGSNLWVMHNEINKLALFTSGRRIEEADVSQVVSYARQANVFAMVDAVLEGEVGLAERLLCQLLEAGATPPYILVMLSRQIRLMVRAKALRSQGKSEVEIQRRLGLASDFAFRKTLEQAKRYPSALLREVYRQLLATDLAIKTGRYDGELALNILVARLCTEVR